MVWLGVFLASIIPFAFVPLELYLKKSSDDQAEVELG
jgi:hypothetical protein